MSASTRGKYEVDGDKEAPKGRFSFMYDSNAGTCFGRTPRSWLLITIFYTIYYACLAGFFAGMLSVFLFGVIQDERPHLTGDQSLLRLNPGMGFRPQPQPESSVIKFTAEKNATYQKYVSNLEALYKEYKKAVEPINLRECGDNATDVDPTKVCAFDWDKQMPDCVPENRFGYAGGRPCVVLKLNRIFGWLPDPIDPAVPHPIVRCVGENPADNENLGQPDYQPSLGANGTSSGYFSQEYFPYLKQVDYRSPLVAVVFKNLPRNTLVMVECRLENLNNAVYDKADRQAMKYEHDKHFSRVESSSTPHPALIRMLATLPRALNSRRNCLRLRCRCMRTLISSLLSPLAHAMSMLVITMTLLLTVGDLIARLENFGIRARNDSMQFAIHLVTRSNLSQKRLVEQLGKWSQQTRWNTEEGVYFTFSLLSTIGYGKYCPITKAGRWVSGIFIALFVPIGVLYVQNLSSVYQSMLSRLLIELRQRLSSSQRLSRLIFPNGDETIVVIPITMLTLVMQAHLIVAIVFLCIIEDWTPMQSLYFLISTVTSIGFGDFHTGTHNLSYVLASILFQLHLFALFMLLINYLNDALEWILQAAQAPNRASNSVFPRSSTLAPIQDTRASRATVASA
uniref:Ion_trans_2 domain-containing protein n=1 Tax=Macrostomum lignano TaxID=282301 RepID=A0A1I8GBS7_9PLAT